jgi:hypothetical protein
MGGKGKKKKGKAKNGEKKKSVKTKKGGRKGGRAKSSRCTVDIFTEAAMENAYTICHNVQDLLKSRGFLGLMPRRKRRKAKSS